jgi:hypothetical protein
MKQARLQTIIIVLVAVAVFFAGYGVIKLLVNDSAATGYDACVEAGNEVIKTSPPRCIDNGRTYVGE